MDDDPLLPARGRTTVRLSDPGDIAAGLPSLIGFRPRESLVLITLTGESGSRVGMTVRVDIPLPRHARVVAEALARSVAREEVGAALVAIVSEAPDEPSPPWAGDADATDLPHRALLAEVVVALAGEGRAVRDALLVRGGRWWSYECPHACCAPGAGTPLPEGPGELELASVVAGQVVAADRSELSARIAPATAGAAAMGAACSRALDRRAAVVRTRGRDALPEEGWARVESALDRLRRRRTLRLPDLDVALLALALLEPDVRDRALVLATGADAGLAEILWTECTRRAPAPLDAAPATLVAVHAWLRGDGAMAGIALDRALASDPACPLAGLLAEALQAFLPPDELRRWILTAADEVRPV